MARIKDSTMTIEGKNISLQDALSKYFVDMNGEPVPEAWHLANNFMWFLEESLETLLQVSNKEYRQEIPVGSTHKAIRFYTDIAKSKLDPMQWRDNRAYLELASNLLSEFGDDIKLRFLETVSKRLDPIMNNKFYQNPLVSVPVYLSVFTSFMSIVMAIHHYSVYQTSGSQSDFDLFRSNMMQVFRFMATVAMLASHEVKVYMDMAAVTDAYGHHIVEKISKTGA